MVSFTLRKLLGMIPMLLIITFLIYAGIEMTEEEIATIELSLASLILSSFLGILLGVISALKKGKIADNVLTVAGMVGVAIPQFLFGISVSFCSL